ncbi:MAG: hypothetical protein Q8P31_10030 [Bacillota bacterium]|nr:hypothetical protein [Bacillota bacterium]
MFDAWVVWLVWAASLLVLELVAVFSGRKGDTLSESVWYLLRHGGAVVLLPLYIWLGWHFFLEFWVFEGLHDTAVDDLLIVGLTAAVTGTIQLWQRFRNPRRLTK